MCVYFLFLVYHNVILFVGGMSNQEVEEILMERNKGNSYFNIFCFCFLQQSSILTHTLVHWKY